MEAPFLGHRARPGDVLGRQNLALVLRIAASPALAFRKDRVELDLSGELQFHLLNQIDEYVKQGTNPQQARRAALRSLGGVEQVKEECREAREMNLIENFVRDVR
jgi:hypothetical protein